MDIIKYQSRMTTCCYFNDKKVKTIIQNNLQLFNVLLDKKDLSDKDIYKLLSSDNKENPLKQKTV
ncbi:MAG: hypothetical protein L6V95_05675 [Candidatus Melainabacteria bacterium]|nr:MAG: hypothetical protein L6V95_05675 [Candidatus Melainabacteria bacterium]